MKLFWESVKEPLRDLCRTIVLAVIPVAIDSLNKGFVDWKLIAIVGVIAGLRFIEKYFYEKGKLEKSINPVSEALMFKAIQ